MNVLVDSFGREHTYLRISVTDRCNLRCIYCMPAEGIELRKKDQLLSFEEIERVARVFVEMGVDKIRITGGEPLVRKDLEELVLRLSALPGLKTLALTTNGVLLKEKIEVLKRNGLQALNISLDSLKKERFRELTLRDDWDKVMSGILAAEALGFEKLKLNVVIIRGKNCDEIVDFVEFVKDKALNVRFIEYMPFKDNQWNGDGVFTYAEMQQKIAEHYELIPLFGEPSEVAKNFGIKNHSGTVSFISSMSDSFCASCNRLRMSADGAIKSCLFYEPEINIREKLRAGCTDKDLQEMILYALKMKPEAHPPMEELAAMSNRAMVEIGG
ncbi:MAG: GTP 3',8-cyclase MoaA [Candidatus Obscuribacterales bacterium]|nr:GTP 3',8-cyclase MoaA [Candidatus Obscuribacterales bacterium]